MSSLVSYQLLEGVATIEMDDGKANVLSSPMLASIGGYVARTLKKG